MDDLTKTAYRRRPDLHIATEGEFQGWRTWSGDNFETSNGPFWHREDDDGTMRCAFRVEKKHLNGASNVLIQGNYVGTDATGKSARPNYTGINPRG